MPATAALLPTAPAPSPTPTRDGPAETDSAAPAEESFSRQLDAAEDPTPVTETEAPAVEEAPAAPAQPTTVIDPLVLADLAALAMSSGLPSVVPLADPLADLAVDPLVLPLGDASVVPTAAPLQGPVPSVIAPHLVQAADGAPQLLADLDIATVAPAAVPAMPTASTPPAIATDDQALAEGDDQAMPSAATVSDPLVQSALASTAPAPGTVVPAKAEAPESLPPLDGGPAVDDALAPLSDRPAAAAAPIKEPAATAPVRPAPEANPLERAVANQVVRAVLRHDAEGGRSLVVRLTPPELGTVRVEIIERAGTLTARVSSDDEAVRTALERALPQMRQELRGSDAPIRDVALADTWFGDAARRGRNGADQRSRRGRSDGESFSLDGVAPAAAPILPVHQLGGTVAADRVDARA